MVQDTFSKLSIQKMNSSQTFDDWVLKLKNNNSYIVQIQHQIKMKLEKKQEAKSEYERVQKEQQELQGLSFSEQKDEANKTGPLKMVVTELSKLENANRLNLYPADDKPALLTLVDPKQIPNKVLESVQTLQELDE